MTKRLNLVLDDKIVPIIANNSKRTYLSTLQYLPEWARETEFFRDICILIDYLQNSLLDYSNPKYAMIEQAYKDIGFKYKDIMQLSENALKAMLIENGFSAILETLELPLEKLQMFALYLPLFKAYKGTDVGFRQLLTLISHDYKLTDWTEDPSMDEYTFDVTFITFLNIGFNRKIIENFQKFSRSYVYPVLKNLTIRVIFRQYAPIVHGYVSMKKEIRTKCFEWVGPDPEPIIVIGASIPSDGSSLTLNSLYIKGLANLLGTTSDISESIQINNNWEYDSTYIDVEPYTGNTDYYAIILDGKLRLVTSDTYQSFTGTTWTPSTKDSSLSNLSIAKVLFDGTKFVALDYEGKFISTSIDGLTWTNTEQNQGFRGRSWTSLVYDGTKFVALGYNGYISTSADGTTWSDAVQVAELGSNSWYDLAYDGTKFVALGSDGYISTSTDGITWTTATYNNNLGRNYWLSLAYDGTKFVALGREGKVSISLDGLTWTNAAYKLDDADSDWLDIIYTGKQFVAIRWDGHTSLSKDGLTWTNIVQSSELGNHHWQALAYDENNNKLIAFGRFDGYISYSPNIQGEYAFSLSTKQEDSTYTFTDIDLANFTYLDTENNKLYSYKVDNKYEQE